MLKSAARWLAQTAARFPERVAVEDEWGTLTWRELEEAVERVATAMLELGVERNQPVLVYLPKSRESVVSFLAALYAGCPYAPVDYAIPRSGWPEPWRTCAPPWWSPTPGTGAAERLDLGRPGGALCRPGGGGAGP